MARSIRLKAALGSGPSRRAASAVLGLTLLAAAVSGCGSSMMIATRPSNAVVVVDGREIGRSPVLYQGTNGWDGAVEVQARLEGHREAVLRVAREPNAHHLAESLLFPPAVAWGWYLPDSVTLFLEPLPRPNP